MLDWLIILLILAPVVALLFYLERKHVPKWQIWAVWIASGAIIVGIAGASQYHFQFVSLLVFIILGAFCGAAGALAMEWPTRQRPLLPGHVVDKPLPYNGRAYRCSRYNTSYTGALEFSSILAVVTGCTVGQSEPAKDK